MPLTFTSTHTIDAPRERVLAAMTDFATWPDWMAGLVRVDPLTEGPYGVGTRWREVRKMFGKEAAEVFEVVGYEPPHTVELFVDGREGSTGKGTYHFHYTLDTIGESLPLLRLDAAIELPGLAGWIMARFGKGMFQKAVDRDTLALKALLERE